MGCGDEKLSKYLTQTFTAHCNAMICQQVTLSGDAEWPKVADAVIEAEIEAVKSILYYKNYLPRSPAPSPWPIRPLVAALDAIDTLGDCAAAPTRPTPGPRQS